MKIPKKIYIIAGGISIVLLILIAIVIVIVTSPSDDNPSTDPSITDPDEIPLPYENALIVKINNSTLWARDVDSDDSMYLIKNWTTSFHSFDFYGKKNIYFGNTITGRITSYSRQFIELSQSGKWIVNKIAVDYVHEKLYVLDGMSEKINVFDIRNGYYNIISIDLYQPEDVAVDPIQKCLFVLQFSSILKSNLDGTSPKTIVERYDISTFQIDTNETRIYWATRNDIQSANYAGQNLIIVKKINKAVISLAISRENLFWLNPSSDYEKSTLWLCKIINGVCNDTSSAIFDENAVEIKTYNFDRPQVSNPCDSMRNCQHMCVNSNDKPRCVCNVGWQLKNDSDNCQEIDEFLMYMQGDFVKGRSLDFSTDTFTSALLPIKLNVSHQSIIRVIHFDFDARHRELVFSDDYSIHKLNLKPDSQQMFIGGDSKYSKINPVIDWITGNIYYVRAIHWDYYSIAIRNIEPYDHSIADYTICIIPGARNPRSLAVHPNRGYLFFTLQNDMNRTDVQIVRTYMDGSKQSDKLFVNLSVSALENSLAIDYEEDRIFWFDTDLKNVYSADLDGSNLKSIDVSIILKPSMMNVYGDYIYVSNLTSIWRVDKKTGKDILKVLPIFGYESQTIRGAKVFSKKSQIIDDNHPCADNNGGCERYCLAKPKVNTRLSKANELERVCACNSDEELDSDDRSCVNINSRYLHN